MIFDRLQDKTAGTAGSRTHFDDLKGSAGSCSLPFTKVLPEEDSQQTIGVYGDRFFLVNTLHQGFGSSGKHHFHVTPGSG